MALSVVSRGVKHPGSLNVATMEPATKTRRLSQPIRSVASLPLEDLGGVGVNVVADAEEPSGKLSCAPAARFVALSLLSCTAKRGPCDVLQA